MQIPQVGVLYAKGHGRVYSTFHLISLCVGISSILYLVPRIGTYGAFLAFVLQELVFRFAINIYCKKKCSIAFFDKRVLVGVLFILFSFLAFRKIDNSLAVIFLI
jgi:O-antigen/teichoic acid export membrane protein